jgi:hypothetical protein
MDLNAAIVQKVFYVLIFFKKFLSYELLWWNFIIFMLLVIIHHKRGILVAILEAPLDNMLKLWSFHLIHVQNVQLNGNLRGEKTADKNLFCELNEAFKLYHFDCEINLGVLENYFNLLIFSVGVMFW